jgi:hypothetical protein
MYGPYHRAKAITFDKRGLGWQAVVARGESSWLGVGFFLIRKGFDAGKSCAAARCGGGGRRRYLITPHTEGVLFEARAVAWGGMYIHTYEDGLVGNGKHRY